MKIKNVLWSVIGILILLTSSTGVPVRAAQASSETSMAISVNNLVVNPGESFDINVIITTDFPTRGAQCELHFDPSLVEVTGVIEGSFYKDWAQAHEASTVMMPNQPSIDNSSGMVPSVGVAILGGKAGEGSTGSGTLLVYHVLAKKDIKGQAALTLENVQLFDSGSTGNILAISNVKQQSAIVGVGEETAPLQPAQEDVPTPASAISQETQPETSTIKSLSSISAAAQKALSYLAQKENVPEDTFAVTGDYANTYTNLGRTFQMVTLVDTRPWGKAYKLIVALDTGEVSEDVAAIDLAEAKARYQKYGKFQPDLYDKLQTMQDADKVEVAFWTTEKTGQSLDELEAQANQALAKKYPQVKAALDRNDKITDVGDIALSRQIESDYLAIVDTGMSQRIQPLVQALQDLGITPTTLEGAPFLFVNLTKKDLATLAQRDDVGAIYDAEETAMQTLSLDSAEGSDRLPTVGNQLYDGSGVNVAVLENGNIDFTSPDGSLCPASSHNCFSNPGSTLSGMKDSTNTIHATDVASIIASNNSSYRGVAPGITISSAGIDSNLLDDPTINALKWALNDAQADVVNTSFGVCKSPYYEGSVLDKAFDYYARLYNRLIVASSGNTYSNEPCNNRTDKPATGWNVFAVGAYNDQGDTNWAYSDPVNFPDKIDKMEVYSNYVNPSSPHGDHEKPEVVAPGNDIDSIGPDGTPYISVGTSDSAPQATGLAALLIQANPGLRNWPEALRSIIMASAVHNIDGPAGIPTGITGQDLQDGAGGIDGTLALSMSSNCPTGTAGSPCWWGDAVLSATTQISHSIQVTRGERVRIAINWWSNSLCTGEFSCGYDRLDTDLDLVVYDPSGNPVATSSSYDNNYELVDFDAPQSGAYTIHVNRADQNGESNSVAIAWVTDSTYIDNLRNNINGDGFVSSYTITNIGSQSRTVNIYYYSTNGNSLYNNLGLDHDTCSLAPGQQCSISASYNNIIPNNSAGSAYVDGGEDVFVDNNYQNNQNVLYILGSKDIFPIAQVSDFQFPASYPGKQTQVIASDSDLGQQALLNGLADVAMSSTPCSTANERIPGTALASPYHCNQLENAIVGYKNGQALYMYILPQALRQKQLPRDYINWIGNISAQSIVKNMGDTPIGTYAPNWDVNLDFVCDTGDIAVIGNTWMMAAPFSGNSGNPTDPLIGGWFRADANLDGVVNIGDVAFVGSYWLQTW